MPLAALFTSSPYFMTSPQHHLHRLLSLKVKNEEAIYYINLSPIYHKRTVVVEIKIVDIVFFFFGEMGPKAQNNK